MARKTDPTSAQWPADHVERRPVADLVPYARNARTHSDAQVAQLAASIREWGWTVPVLVDESGTIIAGHGRVLAAQKLGLADVPTMVARDWSEAQKRAYVLADNKLALNAGWDEELLRVEIAELHALDAGKVALVGFDNLELREIVFPAGPKEKSGDSALSAGLSFQVVVECEDENQQAEVLEDLRARGIKCKPLIL